MGQGFQCFDAAGRLTVDSNDFIGKVIGTFTTTPGVAGSLAVPLQAGQKVFAVKLSGINYTLWYSLQTRVSVSGNTIAWTAGQVSMRIVYGVY